MRVRRPPTLLSKRSNNSARVCGRDARGRDEENTLQAIQFPKERVFLAAQLIEGARPLAAQLL